MAARDHAWRKLPVGLYVCIAFLEGLVVCVMTALLIIHLYLANRLLVRVLGIECLLNFFFLFPVLPALV